MLRHIVFLWLCPVLTLLLSNCGKKSGGSAEDVKPQKPTLTSPSSNPSPGELPLPQEPSPIQGPASQPPVAKPHVTPAGQDPASGGDPFANALTGLWAVAIAQKPFSCSSIYDLRNVRALNIHLLCPGNKGRTISLQTGSFVRASDDGRRAVFRRASSTCGVSPTTAGSVFVEYSRDANGALILNEGSKASPLLVPLAESNYAAELKTATALHNRPIIRGCFRNGNLQNFEARRTSP